MADDAEIGAEIRTTILELTAVRLKKYRPDLARSRGTLPGKNIGAGTVTTVKINDGAITGVKLADGAVDLASAKVTGILSAAKGGTGIDNGARTLTISTNAGTLNFTGIGKTLSIANSLSLLGTDGKSLNLGGNLVVSADTTISGGGTLALGGFTGTLPATGTLVLRGSAFTAGRVPFASDGNTLADSANLVWNNVNARLGVGLAIVPEHNLHVHTTTSNTGILLSGATPSIVVRMERASGGAATWFFEGALKNTTTALSTTGGRIGILGDAQSGGTPPSITYLWLSAAPQSDTTPWSGAPFKMTPGGFVGIGLSGTTVPASRLHVQESGSTNKVLVVQGAVGHSVALQEWQDGGGVVVASIGPEGTLGVGAAAVNTIGIRVSKGFVDTTTSNIGISLSVTQAVSGVSLTVGSFISTWTSTTGNISTLAGINVTPTIGAAATSNVSTLRGIFARVDNSSTGGSVAVNAYGVYIANPGGAGAITNNYGLIIESINRGGTLNYAIHTSLGLVHFGDNVDLSSGKTLTMPAGNIITDTTTGMKIGTATAQKFAFHNATPVAQRAGAAQAAVATTPATNASPWGFTTQAQADAIITLLNELRAMAVEKGLMKGSA